MVAERPGVDGIHGGEVSHVHQVDRGLHDAGQLETLGLENRADVGENALRLLRDVAVHQLAGGGIEAHLAGGEKQPVGAGGLTVWADGARRVWGRDETNRHQNSPAMVPSGWTRIASADGVLLRPGIVMISPARATTKPAPADGETSRMVRRKPLGRPSLVASSLKLYCVLAMQTGVAARPMASHWAMFFSAAAL